ncbi:MAG: GTP cyclohydrolase I FolE, partial [Gammaproteobacteria bacterium]|nr:GTP cyclohydrolase I FolE [Gammaproteobacteria bacterium]
MDAIATNIEQIIRNIGEDPAREGLADTPRRTADALRFLTQGYGKVVDDVVRNALFESDLEEIILVKDIELYSLCEHHMMPFIGKCHVGYLPNGKVLGISKVASI